MGALRRGIVLRQVGTIARNRGGMLAIGAGMKLLKLLVPALASALVNPSTARADFGRRGVVVIESDIDLDIVHISTTQPDGDSSSRSGIDLAANAKYFVADHVSLGLGIDLVRQSRDDDDPTTAIGVRITAGYQLRMRSRIHLWPGAVLAVARASSDSFGGVSLTRAGVSIYAPAVFEVADHFVIGWGPLIGTEIYASLDAFGSSSDEDKSTILGTSAFVAGWF
jgi:hypothetical protein